jgi:hypothetical protein
LQALLVQGDNCAVQRTNTRLAVLTAASFALIGLAFQLIQRCPSLLCCSLHGASSAGSRAACLPRGRQQHHPNIVGREVHQACQVISSCCQGVCVSLRVGRP